MPTKSRKHEANLEESIQIPIFLISDGIGIMILRLPRLQMYMEASDLRFESFVGLFGSK